MNKIELKAIARRNLAENRTVTLELTPLEVLKMNKFLAIARELDTDNETIITDIKARMNVATLLSYINGKGGHFIDATIKAAHRGFEKGYDSARALEEKEAEDKRRNAA